MSEIPDDPQPSVATNHDFDGPRAAGDCVDLGPIRPDMIVLWYTITIQTGEPFD